ncbi:hypothetical protein GBA52_027436 [Prunus armeniaca]|nr:hypothetical protein GBA52_027436 [Prunus armeniaca]
MLALSNKDVQIVDTTCPWASKERQDALSKLWLVDGAQETRLTHNRLQKVVEFLPSYYVDIEKRTFCLKVLLLLVSQLVPLLQIRSLKTFLLGCSTSSVKNAWN